jgi:regulator of protease activity HflC (stomatin/prohibitin superfamily)
MQPNETKLIKRLDKTTEDLVHSDLKDFIGNYDMDDLISRPGSRIPSRTTFK